MNNGVRMNKKSDFLSKVSLLISLTFVLTSTVEAMDNLEINGTFSVDTNGIAFNDGQHPVKINFNLTTNYPVDKYQLAVYKAPFNTSLMGYDLIAQRNHILIGVNDGTAIKLENDMRWINNSKVWIPAIDDESGRYYAHIQFYSELKTAPSLDAGVYSIFNVTDWGYIDPEKFRKIIEKGFPDEEIPISGWKFRVIDNNTKPPKIYDLTTDEAGHASCGPLAVPGEYVVQENNLKGWRQVPVNGGKIGSVSVNAEKQKNVSVKYYNELIPGKVEVEKGYDYNGNGRLDPPEMGIPGWIFTARGGPLNRNYVFPLTNNEGYTFMNMSSGQDGSAIYEINDNLPGNLWECTSGSLVQTVSISPDESKKLTFLNRLKPAKIQIIKFCDENMNRIKDGSEGGMVSTFKVIGPDGTEEYQKTNSQGILNFEVLFPMPQSLTTVPSRTYRIEEQPSAGTKPTTPTQRVIEVLPGASAVVYFGNVPMITIHKFDDCNGNGELDQGESGIPNWKFLIQEKGQTGKTISTNTSGWIEYPAKCGKTYEVSEYSEPNWKPTTTTVRSVSIPDDLQSLLFGNMNRSSGDIFKFHDENRNSVYEPGENGLANWTFEIRGPGINQDNPDRVVTDESGYAFYKFPELGIYNITEMEKDGWVSTTGISQDVKVDRCSQTQNVFFGNDRVCLCPIMEDAQNSLKNKDIKVSKEVDPSVLTPDMIDDCQGTWINYTITLQPSEKMAPNDLVLAINQYNPAGNQRFPDTMEGVGKFLDSIQGSDSRVGLFLYNGNESVEVRPNSDYSIVRSNIAPREDGRSPLQFRPTTEESRIAIWTYGIVDQFYADSKPGVSKILVLITDSEASVRRPAKALDANYTVYSIVVGPRNTTTYRLMESLTGANNGTVFTVNNSQELRDALLKLTSVTIPRTLYNVQLIETLPNYMTTLESEGNNPPYSIVKNMDGREWSTITARWNISEIDYKGWNTTFRARFCWNLSADSHLINGAPRPSSKVIYTRENSTSAEIPLPEGLISIQNAQRRVQPVVPAEGTEKASGFPILSALIGLGAGAIVMRRRWG
ncbi:MAG: VWA domain-containing protein [Methanotrichaceae archaeon]|nr:VWA domain-containing protein [Methanotrichaceae archaeon]